MELEPLDPRDQTRSLIKIFIAGALIHVNGTPHPASFAMLIPTKGRPREYWATGYETDQCVMVIQAMELVLDEIEQSSAALRPAFISNMAHVIRPRLALALQWDTDLKHGRPAGGKGPYRQLFIRVATLMESCRGGIVKPTSPREIALLKRAYSIARAKAEHQLETHGPRDNDGRELRLD